jgi:DNA-binding response OmpR family regulator
VLVVDDERVIANTLVTILHFYDFYAVVAYDGHEAVRLAESEPFDVLIIDVMMPGMNGIEASEWICKIHPGCNVILISGHMATSELLTAASACGKNLEVLAKPFHPREIIERLGNIEKETTL